MVTKTPIIDLYNQPKERWALIYCELFELKIPKGFTKPEWWDASIDTDAKSLYVMPWMALIKNDFSDSLLNNTYHTIYKCICISANQSINLLIL